MKERPILFSGPMVKAILAGTKTQTRRVINPQPEYVNQWDDRITPLEDIKPDIQAKLIEKLIPTCSYGQPGDRLWVRETWRVDDYGMRHKCQDRVRYRATDSEELHWNPSIHMPRWASRITLEIVSVRVERVQDISEADAQAEGIFSTKFSRLAQGVTVWSWEEYPTPNISDSPRIAFQRLWDLINEKRGYGWSSNPWVWVLDFKRVEPPERRVSESDMAAGVRSV